MARGRLRRRRRRRRRGGGAAAARGGAQISGSGLAERGLTRVRVRPEEGSGEEELLLEAEAAGESAVTVALPALAAGAWTLSVSVNGPRGEFVECPTPFHAA